jgi:quercetin dioxygenase-like cupin family protein
MVRSSTFRAKRFQVLTAVLSAGFLIFVLEAVLAPQGNAQQPMPGAQRTVLEKHDLSVPGREGILVRTELPPGAREPMHTHPGDFFAYVLEGSVTLMQEGQPDKHVDAGDVFFVPAGRVHGAANEGTKPAKLLVTFFVEKGKPLTTPVM